MTSFSRFPRLLAFFAALSTLLALLCDAAQSRGDRSAAAALLIYTCMALVVTCALMCCRFFISEQGVGVSTLLLRRRISWDDMAAIGYLRLNGRRVYLYGMSRRHASFHKLIRRAPLCSPGRFVVPASHRLRAAVCRYCPFPPEGIFDPPPQIGGLKDRKLARPALLALLLCPAGAGALATGASIAGYACTQALPAGALVLWCVLSALCLAAGCYLLAGGINGLLYAPSIGEDGVCVGHGSGRLSMRWTDMTAIWRVYARYGSGLYFFDRDVPSAHPHVRKDGARTPAREPMSCLSLADTHLLLLAVSMYCPDSAVRRIYR